MANFTSYENQLKKKGFYPMFIIGRRVLNISEKEFRDSPEYLMLLILRWVHEVRAPLSKKQQHIKRALKILEKLDIWTTYDAHLMVIKLVCKYDPALAQKVVDKILEKFAKEKLLNQPKTYEKKPVNLGAYSYSHRSAELVRLLIVAKNFDLKYIEVYNAVIKLMLKDKNPHFYTILEIGVGLNYAKENFVPLLDYAKTFVEVFPDKELLTTYTYNFYLLAVYLNAAEYAKWFLEKLPSETKKDIITRIANNADIVAAEKKYASSAKSWLKRFRNEIKKEPVWDLPI